MVQWLKEVFDVAWRSGRTYEEWREAIIIPMYKKEKERKEGKKKNNYGNVVFIAMTGNIWCNANLGSGFYSQL